MQSQYFPSQMSEPNDLRFQAQRTARANVAFVLLASALVSASWLIFHSLSFTPWLLPLIVSALSVVALQFWRNFPVPISILLHFMSYSAAMIANVMMNLRLAESRVHFEPFNAFKYSAIAVVILAPVPTWVGYATIGLCAIAPLTVFAMFVPPEIRAAFPVQEPWSTLVVACLAAVALHFRLKGLELERSMARLKAERRALNDLARIFLGLRDLTNTPLQTIELSTRLLESGKLSGMEGSAYIRRSLVHLRELSEILALHEHDVDWSHTESSFDASILLNERLSIITGGTRSGNLELDLPR